MNYPKKHGGFGTRLYTIWIDIKQRCLNTNNKRYKDYGGRGITVCPEWTESYIEFRNWALSNGYADNLTIDRKENNGNYEPNNCRFITRGVNGQNRRTVKLTIELANEIRNLHNTGNYTQKELAEMYNVSRATIGLIINNKKWKI